MTNARTILEFMAFAEGLKNVLRHSVTSAGRRESVAEHAWMLGLLAISAFEAVDIELDRLRVLKMIAVHDLPEIITGDIPTFDKEKIAAQAHADETAALAQIAQMGPLGPEIVALCEEFDARETPEARFARALDKAEALIQHNLADLTTWDANDFTYQTDPHHPRNAFFDVDPFLQALKRAIDHDTMHKLDAAGQVDKAHPDLLRAYRNGELDE